MSSLIEKTKAFAAKFCEPLIKATPYERSKWLVLTCVFASACVAGEYFFYTHYRVGIDTQKIRCLDEQLFIVDLKKTDPVKDKIFAITAEGIEPIIKDGTRMAKYIRGVPGDKVTITPDEKIYINDKLIASGMAHLHGAKPKDMRKFFGSRVLGDDEYWVMGTRPMSFDSRYYGPVHRTQIEGRAYAIF